MKESFWGVLIVMLGLFGVMLINVFQKITIGNDEVYYLLKETNEAAMYDSIDFSYYRLTGDIKIVEDKFAENFARRFGQNIMMRGNYKITIQDVNEVPPRSSVKVVSKITSLAGDEFGIENRIDGILEAKYKLEEITDFLGITKEEWVNRSNINDVKGDTNSKACVITTIEDTSECMEGDIELSSWEDVRLSDKTCQTDEAKNVNREINYKVCECGKWKEYTDTVASTIKKEATRYVYTWEYVKEGALREFRVSANAEVEVGVCTKEIEIYVPKNLKEREPSGDNSAYVPCGNGIRIPENHSITLHLNYKPSNASNRNSKWTIKDENILGLYLTSNPNKSVGYSKATILAKKIGSTTVTSNSILAYNESNSPILSNISPAVCKVTIWDGSVDSLKCDDKTIETGDEAVIKSSYEPYNASKTSFTWKISNSSIASINEKTGTVKGKDGGSATITVTASNGKKATCTLTVKSKPIYNPPSKASNGGYYEVKWVDTWGNIRTETYYNRDKAIEKAGHTGSTDITISYVEKDTKYKYATGGAHGSSQGSHTGLTKVDGGEIDIVHAGDGSYIKETDKSGNITSCKGGGQCKNTSTSESKNTGTSGSGSKNTGSSSKKDKTTTGGSTTKPKPGGGCFLKGTKVLTINGYKNIEDISINDRVLSFNEATGKNEYKRVLKIYVHKNSNETFYSLTINNKIITSTGAHRFYVKTNNGHDWVAAENLKVGDVVMDVSGKYYNIEKITSEDIVQTVYNLEVKDNHNYYVTESKILVHNAKRANKGPSL